MRWRMGFLVLAACLCVEPLTHAQGAARYGGRVAHNSVLRDWRFVTGEVAIAVTQSLDGYSTCRAFGRGYVEGHPIGRGGRSCGTAAGTLAGAFVLDSSLNYLVHRFAVRKTMGRLATVEAFSVPAVVAPMHAAVAIRNFRLQPFIPSAAARARIGPQGE